MKNFILSLCMVFAAAAFAEEVPNFGEPDQVPNFGDPNKAPDQVPNFGNPNQVPNFTPNAPATKHTPNTPGVISPLEKAKRLAQINKMRKYGSKIAKELTQARNIGLLSTFTLAKKKSAKSVFHELLDKKIIRAPETVAEEVKMRGENILRISGIYWTFVDKIRMSDTGETPVMFHGSIQKKTINGRPAYIVNGDGSINSVLIVVYANGYARAVAINKPTNLEIYFPGRDIHKYRLLMP